MTGADLIGLGQAQHVIIPCCLLLNSQTVSCSFSLLLQLLAANVLNPRSIDVSLDDIGGLDHVKDDMRLKVLKPLSEPDTFCTTLWRPVKGVLFYGPPGTGQQHQ